MTSVPNEAFERSNKKRRRILRNRIIMAVMVLLLVIPAGLFIYQRVVGSECGGPDSGVQMIDEQCVGVTDGSFAFLPEYSDIAEKIAAENKWVSDTVNDPNNPPHRAVTVAVLNPMTVTANSAFPVDEVRNLLEGSYTAQYRANHSRVVGDSDPLIRLVLANEGSHQKQWQPVVRQLVEMKEDPAPLNAVVGLGISIDLTEQAARELSDNDIPTIGAITTADQLTNIPGFLRVSPSNRGYVASLKAHLDRRPELDSAILVYDSNSSTSGDIFVESLRQDLTSEMQGLLEGHNPLSFVGTPLESNATPGLFHNITTQICAEKPKVVFFAGRKIDLTGFLDSLGNRVCQDDPMTVITVDADTGVFGDDEQKLQEQQITVVYADASDPIGWRNGVDGTPQYFPAFQDSFSEELGFPLEHLNDGGAISHHDAVLTAARAIQLATNPASSNSPTSADVFSQLLNLHISPVPGASGTLSFSERGQRSGDPIGKPIPVLEFPSPPPGTSPTTSEGVYITVPE